MTRTVAVIRLAVALLMVAAVGREMLNEVQAGTFVPWDFFGYFTIQACLIGATALAAAALTGQDAPAWVEYLRACAAVYLVITVTVYWVMLAPIDTDVTRWSNLVNHGVSGAALLVDWLLVGPRRPLPLGRLWVVLVYPVAWVAVALVRGATDGWVPYPFLDPVEGYAAVAVTVAGIVIAMLAIGAVLFRTPPWRAVGA